MAHSLISVKGTRSTITKTAHWDWFFQRAMEKLSILPTILMMYLMHVKLNRYSKVQNEKKSYSL